MWVILQHTIQNGEDQLPLRIDIVQRQAQHLGLTLVGVPMHRASSEPFVNRVGRALELLQKEYGKKVAGQNIGEKIAWKSCDLKWCRWPV